MSPKRTYCVSMRLTLLLFCVELGDTDNTEEINGGGEGAEEFNETS